MDSVSLRGSRGLVGWSEDEDSRVDETLLWAVFSERPPGWNLN